MRRLLMILLALIAASAVGGCGPRVVAYGEREMVYLREGEPAPFAGWLLSDADLEVLLKGAGSAAEVPAR